MKYRDGNETVPAPYFGAFKRHEQCKSHTDGGYGGCESCDDLFLEPEYAVRYAVACLVYYDNPQYSGPMMADAQFDGIANWLLKQESYKRIEWLDYTMLRAGSGYDPARWPKDLHELAGKRMGDTCKCRVCREDSE